MERYVVDVKIDNQNYMVFTFNTGMVYDIPLNFYHNEYGIIKHVSQKTWCTKNVIIKAATALEEYISKSRFDRIKGESK